MSTPAQVGSRAVEAPGRAGRAARPPKEAVARALLARDPRLAYALSLLIAALVAAVSSVGLVMGSAVPSGPDPAAGYGIRTSTAGVVVPGFLAHDGFNLTVALPLLLVLPLLARRGSFLGLLLWPGALFYALYTYVGYMVGAPFGPLFLPHAALVALSGVAAIDLLTAIDGERIRGYLGMALPARAIGGLLVGLGLMTLGQDGGGALAVALAGTAEPISRHVWVADLAFEVPATVVGGLMLWGRRPVGYAVGAGLLFQFALTPLALAAIAALQPILTGSAADWGSVVGLLAFAGISLTPLWWFARGRAARREEQG